VVQPTNRQSTRTLVLGLGNPVLTDDSVGLRVADALRTRLGDRQHVDVDEDCWGGLRIMERLVGYDRAVVIDAICSGARPGTIHELTADAMPTRHSASAHDVNLPTAMALGYETGARLPALRDIAVVGVEAHEVEAFGETCTPDVEAAIPGAVDTVLRILDNWR
jgi:hydrogenase maturation protease